MDRKLINYLPDYIKDIREYRAILGTEQNEFENLWRYLEYALRESFISTSENYGLGRWEKMLGIEPKASETIDERRFRILSQISSQLPYTYRQLEIMLENLCGKGRFEIDLRPNEYSIKVALHMDSKNNLRAVQKLLTEIIPANMMMSTSIKLECRQKIYFHSITQHVRRYVSSGASVKHFANADTYTAAGTIRKIKYIGV